jgi:ABC-2 type transport system ATP-binding protein
MEMTDYIIETQNITKVFDGFKAVDGLSLQIKRGEVFGFLGPNGAGKTTSIKMMVGLLKPTSGQVKIDGQDMRKLDKGIIGVCPQELVLWDNLTCAESLKLMGDMYQVPPAITKERLEKLLQDLFLTDKADTLVKNLSGGMKRRLNLALGLIHQPEIVVLDEPSEGLDPQSRRVLWEYIRNLRDDEGKTVILTTHIMDEADRLSDRVAIIDHGKLLRLDTPENLKKEIGEGDIVEITLSDSENISEVIQTLQKIENVLSVFEVEGKVNLRGLNVLSKLPLILENLEKKGIRVADLSMRQNTLEDVFIDLTGTSLRE